MKIKGFLTIAFVALLTFATIASNTTAAKRTVIVTPTNEQGFMAYAEFGGTVSFVADRQAPSGSGALRLTTNNTNESLAQYIKETDTDLADVKELSYYTKQNSGSPAIAAASFALGVDTDGINDGTDEGFTFLVYEPYLQDQTIVPGVFQYQDVANGRLYSTQTVSCSNGTIESGAGGAGPFYTLDQVNQACPEAVVNYYGVFIGSYNPNYDVEVDLLNFDGTVYDFEPNGTGSTSPTSKEDCKNGGYSRFSNPSFRNQGQCIQFVKNRESFRISRN